MLVSAVGLIGTARGREVTCLTPHLELVSQSLSGTVTSVMSGMPGQSPPPSPVAEKIDFERFNFYTSSSASSDFVNPITNETTTIKADVVQIINLGNKSAISYTEVNNPLTGIITKACQIKPLPGQIPDAAVLSAILKAQILGAECVGSDLHTYDTWKISNSYDGPVPNGLLPFPTAGFTVKGSQIVELSTAQDSLLHFVHTAMNVDVTQDSQTLYSVNTTSDMTISSAEAGGPSDADLDPAQFGVECTRTGEFDANTFFTSSTPGVFQKHVLATLQAGLRPQHTLIAV